MTRAKQGVLCAISFAGTQQAARSVLSSGGSFGDSIPPLPPAHPDYICGSRDIARPFSAPHHKRQAWG